MAHRWMADRLAAGRSFLHLPSFDDFDDSYDDLIRTVPAWFGTYLSSFWSGWIFRPSWRSCSTCDLWRFWQRTLWFNVFLQLAFRKSHQQTEKSWSRCPNRGTWRFPQNVNQPVSTNQPINQFLLLFVGPHLADLRRPVEALPRQGQQGGPWAMGDGCKTTWGGDLYKWMAHQELYGLELGEKYERYSLMNFYDWYNLLVPQICLKLSSKGSKACFLCCPGQLHRLLCAIRRWPCQERQGEVEKRRPWKRSKK